MKMEFANRGAQQMKNGVIKATVFVSSMLMLAGIFGCTKNDNEAGIRAKLRQEAAKTLKVPNESTAIATAKKGDVITWNVKKGSVINLGITAGIMEHIKVTNISAEGVELLLGWEVFMSEHSGIPIKITYGEEKQIGEFALKASIKAEMGETSITGEPTAKLTIAFSP